MFKHNLLWQGTSVMEAQEPKYRHQFFQTQTKVEVAVLAKNLTADRVTVNIGETTLVVVITQAADGQEVRLLLCHAQWILVDAILLLASSRAFIP